MTGETDDYQHRLAGVLNDELDACAEWVDWADPAARAELAGRLSSLFVAFDMRSLDIDVVGRATFPHFDPPYFALNQAVLSASYLPPTRS